MSDRFPNMRIMFRITRKDGSTHTGSFWYADDQERRRFGESVRDAMLAFEKVETWRDGSKEAE